MAGGAGNDTYYVDNSGDIVAEAVGGGTDTVYANVNYTLRAGSQIEFLRANAGATGLSLTGNEFNNTIVGGTGNDMLSGGGGNDTYYVGNAGDVVNEAGGGGIDTVYASVSYALSVGSEVEFLRANAAATTPEVRRSSNASSGCACRSRRNATSAGSKSSMSLFMVVSIAARTIDQPHQRRARLMAADVG